MRLADLELDLDVFAGPFDLLLTLILREEIDLLEVDLAEVVIAYIDHLESRGELDLEAATEFLVLIAALLELKSRLLLPGEEMRGADRARARRGRRGAAGAAARRPSATGPPPAHLRERLAAAGGPPLPLRRRCRRHSAGRRWREAHAVYDPATLGAAIGDAARVPDAGRRAPHGRLARDRRRAPRAPARAAARGAFTFDEAVARADRVTVAVTLYARARALQAGRADLDPGGAVRRDHDRAPAGRPRERRDGGPGER